MQVRAGFLRKRPADGKPGRVHRRYMVLYEDRISWYVGAGDRNPLGDLMLSESTLVDRELSATADALHVHTRERKLTLLHDVGTAANGGGSLDAWACAVQDCVDASAARFPAQYSLHSGRASAQCSLQSGAEPTVTSHSMTSQHARARGASEQDAELQRAIVESLLEGGGRAAAAGRRGRRRQRDDLGLVEPDELRRRELQRLLGRRPQPRRLLLRRGRRDRGGGFQGRGEGGGGFLGRALLLR